MDDIAQKVVECLAGVFPDLAPEELATLSQATHEAWDSVAHVTMFAALSEAFGVDIDFETFSRATSFALVVAYVREGLAAR